METQHNLSRVLREVAAGNEVGITRRKKLVARILPPKAKESVTFPDFGKRAQAVWGKSWVGASSSELIRQTRGNR